MFEARKDRLIHNDKIEIRRSGVHGYGVFANDFIKKGEILEECHLVEIADQDNPYAFVYDFAAFSNSLFLKYFSAFKDSK